MRGRVGWALWLVYVIALAVALSLAAVYGAGPPQWAP